MCRSALVHNFVQFCGVKRAQVSTFLLTHAKVSVDGQLVNNFYFRPRLQTHSMKYCAARELWKIDAVRWHVLTII